MTMNRFLLIFFMIIMMTGLVYSDQLCFQDDATTPAGCGGEVGYDQATNWQYSFRANDENFGTGTARNDLTPARLVLNYTLPDYVLTDSIIWEAKGDNGTLNPVTINMTVPVEAIWNGQVHLRVNLATGGTDKLYYQYQNSSGSYINIQSLNSGAQDQVRFFEDGIWWTIFDGSSLLPHEISSCAELNNISNMDKSHHYILTDDLDCSAYSFTSSRNVITGTFSGTFDGRNHTITGVTLRQALGSEFGFFQTFSGTIKDVVFKDFDIGGTIDEGGIGSQSCGVVAGKTGTGGVIERVGIRDSGLSCKIAMGFFIGDRIANVNISDSYVLDSKLSYWGSSSGGAQAGGIGVLSGGNTRIERVIIDVIHNQSAGDANIKTAVVQGNLGVSVLDAVWTNRSSNQATRFGTFEGIEIEYQTMKNPASTAFSNFSSNIWQFTDYAIPSFIWEINHENFTGIYDYTPNSSCVTEPGENYYYNSGDSLGYVGQRYHCFYRDGSTTVTPNWMPDNDNLVWCLDQETGIFNLTKGIHSYPSYYISDQFAMDYPYNKVWTNNPIVTEYSGGSNALTMHIISDRGEFYRFDINMTFNGSVYTPSFSWYTRCDGSMYNLNSLRCSDNSSFFYNPSDFMGYCHYWFGDEVHMTSGMTFKDKFAEHFDNTTLDCGDNTIVMNSTIFAQASDNLTHLTVKDCDFQDGTGGSSFGGFFFNNKNNYVHMNLLLDNVSESNNGYNTFIFNNYHSTMEARFINTSSIDFVTDADITYALIQDSDDVASDETNIRFWGNNNDIKLDVTGNSFYDGGKAETLIGFSEVNIIHNHLSSGFYEAPSAFSGTIANISFNEYDMTSTPARYEGFEDSWIAYNNISSGDRSCYGDCDGDPLIFNDVTYNNWITFRLSYSDNVTIEHNNFHNVTGGLELRGQVYNSFVRFNDFIDADSIYLRDDADYNQVYANTYHCTPYNYTYGCIGINFRTGCDHNEIYSNGVTGHTSYAVRSRDSDFNQIYSNNFNVTVDWQRILLSWNSPAYGIYLTQGSDYSYVFGNSISINVNESMQIDSGSTGTNTTLNDFFIADVVDYDSSYFQCNTYNDGSSLVGAVDVCSSYGNQPMVCTGIINTSIDVNTSYQWNISCTDNDTIANFTIDCGIFSYSTDVNQITYDYLNASIIEGEIICQMTFCDDNIFYPGCTGYSQKIAVILPPPDTNQLQIGICPSSQTGIFTLIMLVMIGLILIFLGLFGQSAFFGIFGCLVMLFASFYLSGCSATIGVIIKALGFVGIVWFAIRKNA